MHESERREAAQGHDPGGPEGARMDDAALEAELAPFLTVLASAESPPAPLTAKRHVHAAASAVGKPTGRWRRHRALVMIVGASVLAGTVTVAALGLVGSDDEDATVTTTGSVDGSGAESAGGDDGSGGAPPSGEAPAGSEGDNRTLPGDPLPGAGSGPGVTSPDGSPVEGPAPTSPSPPSEPGVGPSPTTPPPAAPPTAAVLVLACPGIRVSGPGSFLNSNGSVVSNCGGASSVSVAGGSSLTAPAVVSSGTIGGGGFIDAPQYPGWPAMADPFAGRPAVADCYPSQAAQSGCPLRPGGDFSGNATLSPGRYSAPIKVKAGGNVTLAPGIFDTPGFVVEPGARVSGAGVLVHNRSGAIQIDGCATFQLSPVVTGPFAGLTLMQPASNSSAAQLTRTGGCSWEVSGAVYLPTAELELRGDVVIRAGRLVVAALEWDGTARVTVDL